MHQKKNTAKQLSCCLEKQNTSQPNIKPASEELAPLWGAAGVPWGWVGGWAPCLLAQLLALALMPAQPPRHAPGEGHCPEWGVCGLLPSHPGRGFQGRGSAPVVGPRSLGTERRLDRWTRAAPRWGAWGRNLGGPRAGLLLELRAAGSGRPSVAGPGRGERPGLVEWVGAPHRGPSWLLAVPETGRGTRS